MVLACLPVPALRPQLWRHRAAAAVCAAAAVAVIVAAVADMKTTVTERPARICSKL
jgi:hypothetical protein